MASSTTTKTMTCRQLGGACDLQLQGASADDIINLQDVHLKEVRRRRGRGAPDRAR